MGKHKKKQSQNEKLSKIPPQKRQQLSGLVEKLLNKCTDFGNKQEWADYEEIYGMVQEIRSIEKDYNVSFPKRENNWESFLTWCFDSGANYEAIEIKKIGEEFGLIAKCPLKEGDLILQVPRMIMMTTTTALDSTLGCFIQKDPILQHMPNVVLALQIMNEFVNPHSFWQPYVSILPAEYNTLLYFTPEELKILSGSLVQEECIKMYRNIARQYSYFYKQFQTCPDLRSAPLKHCFTYDFYRWAVSTVMTRQNMIPSCDGDTLVSALVPLWDMCNHINGKISTDYSVEKNSLQCMAMKDYSEGDEIYIFYGGRSNAEFFIHNGFVYPDNQFDTLSLKLGISKSDPLFSSKSQLCSKLNIPVSGSYLLKTGDNPIDNKLMEFLKILVMKEDDTKKWLELEGDLTASESDLITKEALKYLNTRINLLLRLYPTDLEDDQKTSIAQSSSSRRKMAIQLRKAEKQLLQSTLDYINNYERK